MTGVQELLGHSSIVMTMRYATPTSRPKPFGSWTLGQSNRTRKTKKAANAVIT
jgi:integrase